MKKSNLTMTVTLTSLVLCSIQPTEAMGLRDLFGSKRSKSVSYYSTRTTPVRNAYREHSDYVVPPLVAPMPRPDHVPILPYLPSGYSWMPCPGRDCVDPVYSMPPSLPDHFPHHPHGGWSDMGFPSHRELSVPPSHVAPPTYVPPTHVAPQPYGPAPAPRHVASQPHVSATPSHAATQSHQSLVPSHVTPQQNVAPSHMQSQPFTHAVPSHIAPQQQMSAAPSHVASQTHMSAATSHVNPLNPQTHVSSAVTPRPFMHSIPSHVSQPAPMSAVGANRQYDGSTTSAYNQYDRQIPSQVRTTAPTSRGTEPGVGEVRYSEWRVVSSTDLT